MTGFLLAATTSPAVPGSGNGSVTVNVGDLTKPSQSIVIVIAVTLLAVAPSLLVMLTGFTRIVIVLGLTRNALGLQAGVPPNQVLAGLALFFSLFLMMPTLKQVNDVAIKPYNDGKLSATQAFHAAEVPLKTWMLKQTGKQELSLTENEAKDFPKTPADAQITTVIPAFMLSQLKQGFIIGFVIFIPFLIVDLLVSSTLMSMGVVMLPPTLVSLPFKILLFVMVDGWTLVTHSLFASFNP